MKKEELKMNQNKKNLLIEQAFL